MYEDIFKKLKQSTFRSRFKLSAKDKVYIADKGIETIRRHAVDFIAERLAPAVIDNDGKQTPMRNHPVFIAQHATATCCRQCLAKWHHIPAGIPLSNKEQTYIVNLIMAWIESQLTS